MGNGILKIAGVQMDILIGELDKNLAAMESRVHEITEAGAWMTVFPECTTTGYCFDSLEQAREFAEPSDGPGFQRVHDLCAQLNTRIVYGYLEIEDDKVFNSLSLVTPDGLLGSYRKVHLPTLGVDRFTTPGDRFQVFDLPEVRIGMCICYDSSFPEAARVLSLDGADLIVLPTNWPPTSGLTADVIPAARALENHVYFMAINRIGNERGFEFVGKSRICDPSGTVLDIADHDQAAILYAEIDPDFARAKHRVNIRGAHEVHRIDDRAPGTYKRIVEEQ